MSAEDDGGRPFRRFSGRRAREAREAAGVTRKQMAAHLDRTYQSVGFYEQGRINPPDGIAHLYAEAAGVDVDDLLEPVPEEPAGQDDGDEAGDGPVSATSPVILGNRWVLGGKDPDRSWVDTLGNSGP